MYSLRFQVGMKIQVYVWTMKKMAIHIHGTDSETLTKDLTKVDQV